MLVRSATKEGLPAAGAGALQPTRIAVGHRWERPGRGTPEGREASTPPNAAAGEQKAIDATRRWPDFDHRPLRQCRLGRARRGGERNDRSQLSAAPLYAHCGRDGTALGDGLLVEGSVRESEPMVCRQPEKDGRWSASWYSRQLVSRTIKKRISIPTTENNRSPRTAPSSSKEGHHIRKAR